MDDQKELKPYLYGGNDIKKKSPSERVKALKEIMQTIRPLITPFEVGTLQEDALYTSIKVTYRQAADSVFEVTNIEDNGNK